MMMAESKDREKAGLAIIAGVPEMSEESSPEDDLDLALTSAAEEIMAGVEAKDPEMVKSALRSFVEMSL